MPAPGFTTKLLLAITVIVACALGAAFVALHRGTESELRSGLDDDLRAAAGQLSAAVADAGSPDEALSAARREIAGTAFGEASQLLAVEVPGAGVATNQPELLGVPEDGEDESDEGEEAEEREEAEQVLAVPDGFSDLELHDAGAVRVLSQAAATSPELPPARIIVAQPTASIDQALDGLSRTFLFVGVGTLLAALAAGGFIASRMTRPLREMAEDSERVDRDLGQRIRVPGADDEVRRLAEAFNRALDRLQDAFAGQQRFVADASHELRTPLTVIRGQIEVLARQPSAGPDEVQRVGDLVMSEVDRMEQMVEDMLSLAQGESGSPIEHVEVGLRPLVEEAFDTMRVTADRRFDFEASGDPRVSVNPAQIGQLVRILVRNAIEHTDSGGRVCATVSDLGDVARILIDDDGPGVPAEERERVFSRFHRASPKRTGGAGLGLAIAKALVEEHSGSISIEPSPLGGARVVTTLPCPGSSATPR